MIVARVNAKSSSVQAVLMLNDSQRYTDGVVARRTAFLVAIPIRLQPTLIGVGVYSVDTHRLIEQS